MSHIAVAPTRAPNSRAPSAAPSAKQAATATAISIHAPQRPNGVWNSAIASIAANSPATHSFQLRTTSAPVSLRASHAVVRPAATATISHPT